MIGRYDEVTARWGNPDKPVTLSEGATAFLTERVGAPKPTQAVPRIDIVVPPTGLDDQARAAVRPGT